MDSNSDEAAVTPDQHAAVVLGVLAFQIGLSHGMSLQIGGTPAGKVFLDQGKHNIWMAIYSIALRSYFANGHGDDIVNAIAKEMADLLSNNGRREQIREEFLLADSNASIWGQATDLAAFNVGINASRIGQRLGTAKSAWVPEPYTWVEAFEAAREAAMLGATKDALEIEKGLVEVEEGVDKLIESMTTLSVVATLRSLGPVRDRTTIEESHAAGDAKKGGLSRTWDTLKKWTREQ